MNLWILSDLADSHVREMRRVAARPRSHDRHVESQPIRSLSHRPGWLRRRVGFGLVEAGLHVLATTRSMP